MPNFKSILTESIHAKQQLLASDKIITAIEQAGQRIKEIAQRGGTIYSCGNGGSTCDAMHLTEELVARYKRERPGIRAMHFMDPSIMTCWGNDYSFDDAFARVARTFCTANDALVAISTSGNSKNILGAVEAAKKSGCYCIGLTGKDGGALASVCDEAIIVPASATERIQEIHITIIHGWCEMLEG